jgi:hypothetical protein
MAINVKIVFYSPSKGVYLGGGVWSKDETAKTKTSAPTFDKNVMLDEDMPTDVQKMEVWPSLPGGMASKEDLSNATLPTW